MATRNTGRYLSAKESLEKRGVDFGKSGYFELTFDERELIYGAARAAGYRRNYNPNCCLTRRGQRIEGFFQLLSAL